MFSPRFSISNQILKNLTAIEAAKEIIENAPLIPAWERSFQAEAEARTVHHSTHVEGNPLSLAEAQETLKNLGGTTKRREIQEVINYRNVIKYINNYQNQKSDEEDLSFIEERTILEIHRLIVDKIVPEDQTGQYRKVAVSLRSSQTGQITFLPPKPEEISVQMNEFLHWLRSAQTLELQPVLKAGIIQAELDRMHPFTEGNGRTARACCLLSLYLNGYDIKRFFSLDEYYDRDPIHYYAALMTYQRLGDDLTVWLEYFTGGLAEELGKVKERVLKLSRDHSLKTRIGQVALNERQETLLEFLEQNRRVRNKDWRKLLPSVSDDTVLRDLKDLTKKRLIKKLGSTKAAYYALRG